MKSSIFKTGTVVVGTVTGAVLGTIAAISIVGVATTLTGKIIGGGIAYLVVGGITQSTIEQIADPIIKELENAEGIETDKK